MAFFRQLKLLLWKNGLGVIRQPLWSMTLVAWPLVIFILIAVTRVHFPAIVRDTCYVGPRNLPSTGFFPFLQTLLCNTDSKCHNTSRPVDSTASKSSRDRRSASLPNTSPLADLMQGKDFFSQTFPSDPQSDPAALVKFLENIIGSSNTDNYTNVFPLNALNTSLYDQTTFPDTADLLYQVHPVFKGSIEVIRYIRNWPGQDVSITLGDIVTLRNDSVRDIVKQILQEVHIPLHQALGLMWGKDMVSSYLCGNSNSTMWLTAACSTGTVDMLLRWICHDKVAKEVFLAWTKYVAADDVSFVRELVQSLMGRSTSGNQEVSRSRRSFDTEQQSNEAELFVGVSQALLEIIKIDPEVEMVGQRTLKTSFQSMKAARVTLVTVTKVMSHILEDTENLQMTYQMLMTNQSEAAAWFSRVIDSVVEVFEEAMESEECEELLEPFEWLLSSKTVNVEVWRSVLCQNIFALKEALPMDWNLVVENVQKVYYVLTGQADFNLTLPMMLSEWNNLYNASMQFGELLERLISQLGEDSWMSWIPGHYTHNLTETLQQSLSMSMGNLGEKLEESDMWPCMKNYFHIMYWILNYRPGFEKDPPNCFVNAHSMVLHCDTGLEWPEFVKAVTEVVMSPSEDVLVNGIRGTVSLLQHVYGEIYKNLTATYLNQELEGGDALSAYLIKLILNLDGFLQTVTILPNRNISDPAVIGPLISDLLESAGLKPLQPLLFNGGPVNESTVLDAVLQIIRHNQQIFTIGDIGSAMKDYFYIINWILNYRPGFEKDPPNCFVDAHSMVLHCDTGLEWPEFVNAVTDVVMSPSEDLLANAIRGTVSLLQHVYGEIYKNLTATYLNQELEGGDALSAYLIKLILNLDGFLQTVTVLPDRNISDPAVIGPLISDLLESAGLKPLQPLLFNGGPVNESTVLDAVFQIIRHNQQIFTFGETGSAMKRLEQLIMEFLSLERNLTLSFSHILKHSLLTYSLSINPKDMASLKEALHRFFNQTFDEAILDAMQLLKTLIDSLDGDPTNIILGYLHQLQKFVTSLFRLQNIKHLLSSNGQLTPVEVADLQAASVDFLNLLDPEKLQSLIHDGPDVAQDLIIQKLVAFLPPDVQKNATNFLQDFKALQDEITQCVEGKNCQQGISEIFTLLDQIIEFMLAASGNITITITPTNTVPWSQEQEELLTAFFSLMLPPNDAAHVETFKQTLSFMKLVVEMHNVTISNVQSALKQSNLTIIKLHEISTLAGASSLNDLIVKMLEIFTDIDKKCSGPKSNMTMTSDCVMGLINAVSSYMTNIPALQNETTLLSFISVIVNETLSDFNQVDFSSDPDMAVMQTLEAILTNIKMILQLNQQNSSDITNEITIVEHLIQLVTDMEPFSRLNTTLIEDPVHAQKVFLELVDWYLTRLEMITSNSSISGFLHDFFYITRMQVAAQLAQIELSMFVSEKIEFLLDRLQYPLNGTDISVIGQTTIEIIQHLLVYINNTMELPDNITGLEQLQSIQVQIKLYLDLVEDWIKQPNVQLLLTSMLQWGNSSMILSTPVRDLNVLLQTMVNLLNEDQMAYLLMINNITESLSNAINEAEQPSGLQSEQFVTAILTALHRAMQIPNPIMAHLSSALQQDILGIVQGSLTLIVSEDMSFAASQHISIVILERVEKVIQQTIPEFYAEYLLPMIKLLTTYFESTSTSSGPNQWNQIILNEMKAIQNLLPPNYTAQYYISVVIEITDFILNPGQGNMSLWEGFEGATMESLPEVIGQVITGKADQDTWDKLEQMLETLLSAFEGEDLWNNVSSVMPLFEKLTETVVKNLQAEDEMILSLQMPLASLMRDIALAVNTSHLNISELTVEMQLAIERTLQAAQQTSGTLNCSKALKAWEPVGEAAGVNLSTFAVWCETSLQPALKAYAAVLTDLSHMNMSHMGMEPISVSLAAGRIVKILQSLYHVSINRTDVIEQFIVTLSSQLHQLTGLHLSHEGQNYWYKLLQDMQLQSSLIGIYQLSDELLDVAPFLQPYIEAAFKAMSHILDNYDLNESSSSSQELIEEAAMIFLTSANITLNDIFPMMSGNGSGLNLDLFGENIGEIIKLIIETRVFGHSPEVYQALEHLLATNSTYIMVERVYEMSVWLASTEASGLELLSQALSKMYDIIRLPLSILTKLSMDVDTEAYEELFGNIFAAFNQFVGTSGLYPPMLQHHYVSYSEMSDGHHIMRNRRKRDLSPMMTRDPMQDIIDLFHIDYPAMVAVATL
ncbi:hypothetical protein CRENBAI_025848 [Crenichthys baileyi]|uniref:ATP-binding cassette sub-family A member 12 n=1 Tax=Crenichthys baileyi TaxID=28760 RepID=A0AAV9QR62_9TELE